MSLLLENRHALLTGAAGGIGLAVTAAYLAQGARCTAVRRTNGKCIRARNGSMLVEFDNGVRHVVVGRLLRKEKT